MNNSQVMARPTGLPSPRNPSPRNVLSHRLYRRWLIELWGGKRAAREVVSPDFVGHWPTHDVHGPDELQAVIDDTRAGLKDLQFVVDVGPIVDGDMVAARWIGTGSGKDGPARFTGNDLVRIANGRVVEYWTATARA